MNLWLRLLRVIVGALLGRRIGLFKASALTFRVWPTDLDLNVHMNNARYLSVMDLGRTDLIIRTGLHKLMLRHKWQAVIGGATVRYRRPLRPFQRFHLSTRLLYWDDRWIYLEQIITTPDGAVACSAMVKAVFTAGGKRVDPAETVAAAGHDAPSPEVPGWVQAWRAMEQTADTARAT
ncbi:thioesterase family protein [Caenispirillum salinarum]|uniref:thioesterase family protein n=1 Tax=Caenispirillum salinarum TaxID=859058 RepID=UPI00384F1786